MSVTDQPAVGATSAAGAPRRLGRRVVFAVVALVAGLALVEGLVSLALFCYDACFHSQSAIAERVHTQYDPELGWVGIPSRRFDDLYGPGRTLTTNELGARGGGPVARQPPPGRVRLVCSGDSYTLGYGVGDDETWCAQLEALDPRWETINLGQGGYGIDQAYLWYLRAAAGLDYDVQIFSFIDDDFARMQADRFLGYGKPVLRIKEGQLVAENVPVPRRGYYFPWLTQNARLFRELKLVELFDRARPAATPAEAAGMRMDIQETLNTAFGVFLGLEELNRRRGSLLVLVYLPREVDYQRENWLRPLLREETAKRGLTYLDLTEELSALPAEAVPGLFLAPGGVTYPGAEGHYTAAGNRFVAEALDRRLKAIGPLAQRLASP